MAAVLAVVAVQPVALDRFEQCVQDRLGECVAARQPRAGGAYEIGLHGGRLAERRMTSAGTGTTALSSRPVPVVQSRTAASST